MNLRPLFNLTVIPLLFVAGCCRSMETHHATTTISSTTRNSIVDCYATPHWQQLMIGLPVSVVVHFTNNNEKHFVVIAEGQGSHRLNLSATRDGVRIERAGDLMMPFENDGRNHYLAPGTTETNLFELSSLFDMSTPGTYIFTFSAAVEEEGNEQDSVWPEVAAIATVVVVPKQ
jgi:hypothetical protein